MSGQTMLKEVRVQEAVGLRLAHDLTQIIPSQFKGVRFRKGHVIREEDIPELLNIGKEHIYILELGDGWLHEDDAALRMAQAIAGENVVLAGPSEGKVTLQSTIHGLLKVNRTFIDTVNAIDQIAVATLPTHVVVKPGQSLVGTRVIPLVVEESKVELFERLAAEHGAAAACKGIEVKPFRQLKVGLITTGGEVFSGRIEDKFGPVVRRKVEELGSEVMEQRYTPDDSDSIVGHIRYFQEAGADVILVTGGMSVDPDDRTPGAIKQAGAEIVSHGTPMLPGSMLMVAYLGHIPVMGLPGSVMHHEFTAFDVLFPRICAGEVIARRDITEMGYGGLHSDRG
jgi:molybdenum cofactor synthesis domain-containing protein